MIIDEILQYPLFWVGLIMSILYLLYVSADLVNKGLISFKTFLTMAAVIMIPFIIIAIT